MKQIVSSFLVGVLFAIGLGVSGMTQPDKIWGFLDLFGQWDPSLIFVMVGAIGVHFLFFKLIVKRKTPLFAAQFHLPTRKDIDLRLLAGASLFGIGWGLGGFCPGPAITALASFTAAPLIFVVSMLVGMGLFETADRLMKKSKG